MPLKLQGNKEEDFNQPDFDKSANTINNFFRKLVATQSYAKMFSTGEEFKKTGDSIPDGSYRGSPIPLMHLNKISQRHLSDIKRKVSILNDNERKLLTKIVNSKVMLRHQTNAGVVKDGVLRLYSCDKISEMDTISTKLNSGDADKKSVNNTDFVFFGLEFSGKKTQHPLNTKHSSRDYGAVAYLLENEYRYGYLTLTDHTGKYVFNYNSHEHQKFIKQFPKAKIEVERFIHGDKGRCDTPVFSSKDMMLALGLHLIQFIRTTRDNKLRKFVFSDKLDEKKLDRVINFIFQPEFHLPRMLCTKNFQSFKFRRYTIDEAINRYNTNTLMIDEAIKTKADVIYALKLAAALNNNKTAEYLMSKYKWLGKYLNANLNLS